MWISRRELARIFKEIKRLRWQVADLEEEIRDQRRRYREREAKLEADLRAERESAREREDFLREEIIDEREANRVREERLVDRVLTSRDSRPVTDPTKRPKPSAETAPLTAVEEGELNQYLAWALEEGYAPEIGRKMWYAKRAGNPLPPPKPPRDDSWNVFADMEQITN